MSQRSSLWALAVFFMVAASSAKFPHSPPGCRYPMPRPSVSSPLMVRVESSLNTPPPTNAHTPSLHSLCSFLFPNAYCKTNRAWHRWSLVSLCALTGLKTDTSQTTYSSSWSVVSGSRSMWSMLKRSPVGDTCLHTSVQCHAYQACKCASRGFYQPPIYILVSVIDTL